MTIKRRPWKSTSMQRDRQLAWMEVGAPSDVWFGGPPHALIWKFDWKHRLKFRSAKLDLVPSKGPIELGGCPLSFWSSRIAVHRLVIWGLSLLACTRALARRPATLSILVSSILSSAIAQTPFKWDLNVISFGCSTHYPKTPKTLMKSLI